MEFFPPYQCVNVIRGDVYERYPELREVLPLLDNAISTEEMPGNELQGGCGGYDHPGSGT